MDSISSYTVHELSSNERNTTATEKSFCERRNPNRVSNPGHSVRSAKATSMLCSPDCDSLNSDPCLKFLPVGFIWGVCCFSCSQSQPPWLKVKQARHSSSLTKQHRDWNGIALSRPLTTGPTAAPPPGPSNRLISVYSSRLKTSEHIWDRN